MSGIDDLEAMAVAGNPPTGVEVSAPVVTGDAAPRLRVGDGSSARDVALQGLSPNLREQVIADAADMGIRIDSDLSWLLVGAQVRSWAAAAAAGASAMEVQSAVSSIPDTIYQGAVKASGEVQGGLVAGSLKFAKIFTDAANDGQRALIALSNDQQAQILSAAGLGAEKIKNAATTLTSTLDKAVEQKTLEGVNVFAEAAAIAGAKMAKAAAASRFLWSVSGVAMLLIVFSLLGGFLDYQYLSLTHRITPKPLVISASGKPNCGQITGPSGVQEQVCQIM